MFRMEKFPDLDLLTQNKHTLKERKLFLLSGISYDTNETVLKNAFQEHGDIIEVKVICDRVSGKSKGYGFVRYSSDEAASKALKEMDGQLLDGRNICVHYAHRGEGKEVKDLAGGRKA